MKTALVLLAVILAVVMWAGDRITLEGERTVYTVRCENGAFAGATCSGKLVPAERYRFRALRNRHEVIYWVVDGNAPSSKYTDCQIHDRGNWKCRPAGGEPPTITYEMVDNVPRRGNDPPTLPFQAVRKWKWYLMRLGMSSFHRADF